MVEKFCNKCKTWKPVSEFYKQRDKPDGYASRCKLCNHAKNREWRDKHIEEQRERVRKWQKENPDKIRAWQKANRDKVIRAVRKWRIGNPEKVCKNLLNWIGNNKERWLELGRMGSKNYKARKKGSKGKYTIEEWQELKEFYNHTCLCCGRKEPEIKLEPDHIVPLIDHGSNTIDNIQPLCRSCNAKKNKKTIDYREVNYAG